MVKSGKVNAIDARRSIFESGGYLNHFEIDPENVTDQMSIKTIWTLILSVSWNLYWNEVDFGAETSDEDADKSETVGGAVDYVYNRLNNKPLKGPSRRMSLFICLRSRFFQQAHMNL